jgi:hypothetical protein
MANVFEPPSLWEKVEGAIFGLCVLLAVVAFFFLGVRVGLQVQLDKGLCEKLKSEQTR